jgi:hypothetical protein
MKTKLIIALVEAVALAIGFVLWHFGVIAGWIVPLFLLAPPVIAVVLIVAALLIAMGKGENPFQ